MIFFKLTLLTIAFICSVGLANASEWYVVALVGETGKYGMLMFADKASVLCEKEKCKIWTAVLLVPALEKGENTLKTYTEYDCTNKKMMDIAEVNCRYNTWVSGEDPKPVWKDVPPNTNYEKVLKLACKKTDFSLYERVEALDSDQLRRAERNLARYYKLPRPYQK